MAKEYLTHDELQHIEHANKILREHQETVTKVVNETEQLLNNYLPILATYVNSIGEVRRNFGEEVKHIIQSSRQLQIVTGSVQDVINFMSAVDKLDRILTPELIEKLRRVSGDGQAK